MDTIPEYFQALPDEVQAQVQGTGEAHVCACRTVLCAELTYNGCRKILQLLSGEEGGIWQSVTNLADSNIRAFASIVKQYKKDNVCITVMYVLHICV